MIRIAIAALFVIVRRKRYASDTVGVLPRAKSGSRPIARSRSPTTTGTSYPTSRCTRRSDDAHLFDECRQERHAARRRRGVMYPLLVQANTAILAPKVELPAGAACLWP